MNVFLKLCVGGTVAGLLSVAFSTESQPAASVRITQTATVQKQECQIASNFTGAGAANRQLSAALKRGLGCTP